MVDTRLVPLSHTLAVCAARNRCDQQALRDICGHTLNFENHFLRWYRTYLLSELAPADRSARHQALRQLGTIIYPDLEIAQVLQRTVDDPDPETRRIAETVQQTM